MSHDGREMDPMPEGQLLLARALEAELDADGTIEQLVGAPDAVVAEARALAGLARMVGDAGQGTLPRSEFRTAARERLMARIAAESPTQAIPTLQKTPIRLDLWAGRRQALAWASRAVAGVIALSVAGLATVNASASALPGDPLYGVKQVSESMAVQFAADDETRALALLRRADARLDETARLLEQGRTVDAVQTAEQYQQTADAAAAEVKDAADQPSPIRDITASQVIQAQLDAQQARLDALLKAAPPSAQPGLATAVAASSRHRERATEAEAEKVQTQAPRARTTAEPSIDRSAATATSPATVAAATERGREATAASDGGERGRGEDRQDRPVTPQPRRGQSGNDGASNRRQTDVPRREDEENVGPVDDASLPALPPSQPVPTRRDDGRSQSTATRTSSGSGDRTNASDDEQQRRSGDQEVRPPVSTPARPLSTPAATPERSSDERSDGRQGDLRNGGGQGRRGQNGDGGQQRDRSGD